MMRQREMFMLIGVKLNEIRCENMDMLLGIIGIILCVGGFICIFIGTFILLMIIPIAIKEKEYDMIPVSTGILIFCIVFCFISYTINTNIPKNNKTISVEMKNIVSYEGIANVKDGKYNYDYLYFTQGTDNNYKVLKLSPSDTELHYTDDDNITIMENHTEYLSKYRYLALFSLSENTNYDVYLPMKYK